MAENLPPGVTASQIPGFDDEDTTVNLTCEFPALYVDAEALEVMLEDLAEQFRKFPLALSAAREAVQETIATSGKRADEIEGDELCNFEGDVEATLARGIAHTKCPRCGVDHEIDQN